MSVLTLSELIILIFYFVDPPSSISNDAARKTVCLECKTHQNTLKKYYYFFFYKNFHEHQYFCPLKIGYSILILANKCFFVNNKWTNFERWKVSRRERESGKEGDTDTCWWSVDIVLHDCLNSVSILNFQFSSDF